MEYKTKDKSTEILRDAAKFRDIYNISDYIRKQLCLPWDGDSQISITGSVINLELQLLYSEIQVVRSHFPQATPNRGQPPCFWEM